MNLAWAQALPGQPAPLFQALQAAMGAEIGHRLFTIGAGLDLKSRTFECTGQKAAQGFVIFGQENSRHVLSIV